MRRVRNHILTICAAVLLCGCYNYTLSSEAEGLDLKPNMTIAALRDMWRGETFEVAEPMVVSGVVTSSDKAGNFYQTFTIEDSTGAAEIRAGMRDLHNPYPVGCRLCVRLEGCAVGVECGVLQIGLMPESYSRYAVDYFYSKVLLDYHIVRSGEVVEVVPTTLGVGDLTIARCGSLVRVKGLRLVVDEVEEAEADVFVPQVWSGYRAFADADGNRLYLHTSDYADFAAKEVPTIPCDVTGILQRESVVGVEDECFVLKMRSEDDCAPSVDSAL